jgi:hypothetical protein
MIEVTHKSISIRLTYPSLFNALMQVIDIHMYIYIQLKIEADGNQHFLNVFPPVGRFHFIHVSD